MNNIKRILKTVSDGLQDANLRQISLHTGISRTTLYKLCTIENAETCSVHVVNKVYEHLIKLGKVDA